MDDTPSSLYSIDNLSYEVAGAHLPSPLQSVFDEGHFVDDERHRVFVDISREALLQAQRSGVEPPALERAGPRSSLYWQPDTVRVALVTCGGLAPGLNNVIQSLVTFLEQRYGVTNIFGVPYGYQGFSHDPQTKNFPLGWRRLTSAVVQNIDFEGGSVLGTGRGHSDPYTIVDALVLRGIDILFAVGGEGTLSGAYEIYQEVKRRKLTIGIVGVPKTIDNDVPWVSKTFGFESAVEKAVEALRSAQTEARSAYHGIGLVKLMGRYSGALTATAAGAMNDLDFVLVPEVPLVLEGPHGFLNALFERVRFKGYATVVAAEGAGQDLFAASPMQKDASGNVKLQDIGLLLKQAINSEFQRRQTECNLKYIDPSYMLRAQTTSADDSMFCASLAQNAAHAAMAGKTGCLIGYLHEQFTHVPLWVITQGKKRLDTNSTLWLSVLGSTGQPAHWRA